MPTQLVVAALVAVYGSNGMILNERFTKLYTGRMAQFFIYLVSWLLSLVLCLVLWRIGGYNCCVFVLSKFLEAAHCLRHPLLPIHFVFWRAFFL
ncbi:hypothetical protein BD408DRAFT_412474 [Parasitella parasitica]|nr:hypothetical protein BD408DRAFT_412474 [Parasitella parasitica]